MEGELDSWLERFEARVLSILWTYFSSFLADRSTDLLKRKTLVDTQALVPIELMTADGGLIAVWWYTIVVVEFSLFIRTLLRKIMLECSGFWRRQYLGFNFP